MHMMVHRFQVLLNEERYEKLAGEARRRRLSIAAVIRDAIDHLPVADERRRAAVAQILAADPMPVPADVSQIRGELDSAHDRISK